MNQYLDYIMEQLEKLMAIICFGVTGSPLLFGFQLFAIIWNPDCI